MSGTTGRAALSLSIISHTNAGKTTLARTLLRRDVGEVLDQAHVTDTNERYELIELGEDGSEGRIVLWDTPGFGDSARLLREIEQQPDPLAWLAAQSWDPERDRVLYCSQQAVLNVQAEADIVLYLINASEDPEMAGYVDPEMKILDWIGVPVIALLNQTGAPDEPEGRRRAEERWRWQLASHAAVRDVIALDAFTRCWVQEGLLLLRLQALVPEERRELVSKLIERWRRDHLDPLRASFERLARLLATAATDREPLREDWVPGRARRRAAEWLAARLDTATRDAVDDLVELHRLERGDAAGARGELTDVSVPGDRPDPRRAGLWGGVAGGALGGLTADLMHGGLTLGGGALLGAMAGGLGLGGAAWGFDQVAGERDPTVVWSRAFLDQLARDALLRYMAVAHFGRGSGSYRERERPAFWAAHADAALAEDINALHRCWRRLREGDAKTTEETSRELASILEHAARRMLVDAYPGCERFVSTRPVD